MKRSAFTMLELVFVIIVIGILAVLAMPRFESTQLQLATEQVAAHIRYTQHLALVNDVYAPNSQYWYRARPQISFHSCDGGTGDYYYIGSDSNLGTGHIASDEAAVDPQTRTRLYWHNAECDPAAHPDWNKNLLLNEAYGVTIQSNTCGNTISFDHLGRPYTSFSGAYGGQLTAVCTITLSHPTQGTSTVTIQPTTGYVETTY